jgi:hypothetical protein
MTSHGVMRILFPASAFNTVLALGTFVLLASPVMAQQAVPEIPFESISDPLKLPSDLYFGEATSVAVNSKGHVFVFSRGNTSGHAYAASAAQLLEFGVDGNFIREIGKNLYAWSFAHSVRIDQNDNIWAVDKGSDMVVRFNPEGRVTMVFGRKQEASDESTGPLKHPTRRTEGAVECRRPAEQRCDFPRWIISACLVAFEARFDRPEQAYAGQSRNCHRFES